VGGAKLAGSPRGHALVRFLRKWVQELRKCVRLCCLLDIQATGGENGRVDSKREAP
jgi:hypothetical protein